MGPWFRTAPAMAARGAATVPPATETVFSPQPTSSQQAEQRGGKEEETGGPGVAQTAADGSFQNVREGSS